MTISLTIGRDSFKICHREGARTTVWDVSKNDSEESLIQTFRDVIAFVEGGQAAPVSWHEALGPQRVVGRAEGVAPEQPTNGWAAYAAPEIPEHLKGEVELVQPGEDA